MKMDTMKERQRIKKNMDMVNREYFPFSGL